MIGNSGEWTHVERRKVKWTDLVLVFVNNMPVVTTASQFSSAFSSIERVWDAFIPRSSRSGKASCFGFPFQ